MRNKLYCGLSRKALLLAIVSTIIVSFNSCKKDSTVPRKQDNAVRMQTGISAKVKSWFDGKYPPGSVSPKPFSPYSSGTATTSSDGMTIPVSPDWDRATTFYKGDSVIAEVPIITDDPLALKFTLPAGSGTLLNSYTKLLIIRTPVKTRSVFMSVIADSTLNNQPVRLDSVFLLRKPGTFNGVVLYHTLGGNFLNGFKYVNGKAESKISLGTATSATQKSKSSKVSSHYEQCYEMEYSTWVWYPGYGFSSAKGGKKQGDAVKVVTRKVGNTSQGFWITHNVNTCYMVDLGSGGGGDGPLDPCSCELTVSSDKVSNMLPPCEEGTTCTGWTPPTGPPVAMPVANRVAIIAAQLSLDANTSNWLVANEPLVAVIESMISESDELENIASSVNFVYGIAQSCPDNIDLLESFIDALMQQTPVYGGYIQIYKPYLRYQLALVYEQYPQLRNTYLGRLEAILRANKELLDLSLDMGGMLPVAGAAFDLVHGAMYAVEGDWKNAGLSVVYSIPGWGDLAATAKIIPATATMLKAGAVIVAVKKADNTYHFTRNSARFRKLLGLTKGDRFIAHHVLPLGQEGHPLIQKAVTAGFDLNKSVNGIPLNSTIHSGSHQAYSDKVREAMDDIIQRYGNDINNVTPGQAITELQNLIGNIKVSIINNPTTNINNLTF